MSEHLIENRPRRRILGSLLAALSGSAAPLASFAQTPPKVWRIGVLYPRARSAPGARGGYTDFFEALRDLGYVDGRNIAVQWLFADTELQRLPELAAQLVKSQVDLIVTSGTPAVRAAQQATSTIPILALTFGDPVGSGFAKSLARPGGNITGTASLGEEVVAKRLQILAEIVPQVTRIAYLSNPDNPLETRLVPVLEKAGRNLNKEILIVHIRAASDLSIAFDRVVRARVGALLVAFDSVLNGAGQRIGELALQHMLPSVFSSLGTSPNGLVIYSPNFGLAARSAAMMAVKIFKGAKPADIPIEQPTHFDFVVNLRTAKALGITIPPEVMVQATRVIK